ncbi:helix-turn-helix domain-containing protein [Actinophytocola sp.]|uniref:helix-turn-helix domain-containing protein n=1 Tax=Actinophytocola sp. TaxID=1872138 RepID=UPI002ED4E097
MNIARTESHDQTSQFGALLKQLRAKSGMTQEGLAERAGLGVRTVRRLERGERADARVGTVRRLADALDLAPADRAAFFAAAGFAKPPEPDDPLAEAVRQLALEVHKRWQREEEQQQIHDPLPLPVRWRPIPAELTDSWVNIRRLRKGDDAEPLDLTGQLDQIVHVYRRVPSGRLVVLGRAGAGKTVLTLRFVLDLLRARAAADPVPVIFSVGSWNPTTTGLRDWLIERLVRDHPDLAAPGPGGATLAASLVETNRVLPVLDGFDELAGGLHRPALRGLNATTLPLLLTSRIDEYADAVAGTDVLTAAAGVGLTDLTTEDVAGYLPRTRKAGWQPVLTELREHPDSDLAAVLTTPLMVVLARTIYSDAPDHDPAELLDTGRFPSGASLEDHLLANFVPTVYRRGPGEDGRWDLDRVQHWLGHLSRHLTNLGTYDLAWWQLGTAVRRPARVLVVGFVVGLVIGFADLVVEAVQLLATGLLTVQTAVFLVVFAVALGGVCGVAFGVAYDLLGAVFEPTHVRIRFRGGQRSGSARRVRIGAVGGFLLGLGFGLVRELMRGLMLDAGQGWVPGVVNAVLFGLIFGVAAAFMFWLVGAFEAPMDIRSAASPDGLLRANRSAVLTQLLLFALPLALVVTLGGLLVVEALRLFPDGFVFGLTFNWPFQFGLAVALVAGLGGGFAYVVSLTAWGQWVVFARLWLPLTGRLPWTLPAFLEDAYERGVLRRAGAVYQFRHARLRDHLGRCP